MKFLQISLTRKIQKENEDTYLAYRLQHGEDPTPKANAQKKAQEQADAALALRLQQEERARNGGQPVVQATVHKQPAMRSGYSQFKN